MSSEFSTTRAYNAYMASNTMQSSSNHSVMNDLIADVEKITKTISGLKEEKNSNNEALRKELEDQLAALRKKIQEELDKKSNETETATRFTELSDKVTKLEENLKKWAIAVGLVTVAPSLFSKVSSFFSSLFKGKEDDKKKEKEEDNGDTPLIRAARTEDPDKFLDRVLNIDFLSNSGEIINAVNKKKRTALMEAIANKATKNAINLIYLKAKVDLKDNNGVDALHLAASVNDLPVVRALLKAGASATTSILSEALAKHHFEIASELIKAGASVDATRDSSNVTHLIWAAQECDKLTIEYLLGKGANTQAESNGKTALAWAEQCAKISFLSKEKQNDYAEIVTLLKKFGKK